MTIETTTNKFRYQGNGVTDTFAFTGRIFEASDLVVEIITRSTDALVETLTLTTDYSVTINSDESASVTTVAGKIPSSTQDIQIRSSFPQTQTLRLPVGTVFPAERVEDALDKNVAIIQGLSEEVGRAIKLPVTSSLTDIELPSPVASEVIGWNSTADAIVSYAFGDISTSIDTVFTSLTTGDYLKYDGTNWVNIDADQLKTDLGLGLNNLNATTAPTTGDDSDDGYSVGSKWYDTTADEAYVCLDATVGAAVWITTTLETSDLGTAATLNSVDEDDMSSNSATLLPTQQSVKAYVDNNSNTWTYATEQATTSGTSVLFSSLPSGLTDIEIFVNRVSTNSGSSNLEVVLGTSGGLETTSGAYKGTSIGGATANSLSGTAHDAEFNVFDDAGYVASGTLQGVVKLKKADDDTWYVDSQISRDAVVQYDASGNVDLGDTLDRVQIQIDTGTFDAGSVNIRYR